MSDCDFFVFFYCVYENVYLCSEFKRNLQSKGQKDFAYTCEYCPYGR